MRLVLSRNDSPPQPDSTGNSSSAAEIRKLPQPASFSDAERDALHHWASKHGFILRNPIDEQLAAVVWRDSLKQKQSA